MGDLVRFWYAALFLFASAYTLKEDAHVRVDVFYANFTRRTRSILNVTGTVAFGLPLCWLILLRGMWEKTSLINSPMFNFETSMSGFGMYVKYLMAAFLIVFALSCYSSSATLFSALPILTKMSRTILPKTPAWRVYRNGTFSPLLFLLMMYALGSGCRWHLRFRLGNHHHRDRRHCRSATTGDSGAYFIQDGPVE